MAKQLASIVHRLNDHDIATTQQAIPAIGAEVPPIV